MLERIRGWIPAWQARVRSRQADDVAAQAGVAGIVVKTSSTPAAHPDLQLIRAALASSGVFPAVSAIENSVVRVLIGSISLKALIADLGIGGAVAAAADAGAGALSIALLPTDPLADAKAERPPAGAAPSTVPPRVEVVVPAPVSAVPLRSVPVAAVKTVAVAAPAAAAAVSDDDAPPRDAPAAPAPVVAGQKRSREQSVDDSRTGGAGREAIGTDAAAAPGVNAAKALHVARPPAARMSLCDESDDDGGGAAAAARAPSKMDASRTAPGLLVAAAAASSSSPPVAAAPASSAPAAAVAVAAAELPGGWIDIAALRRVADEARKRYALEGRSALGLLLDGSEDAVADDAPVPISAQGAAAEALLDAVIDAGTADAAADVSASAAPAKAPRKGTKAAKDAAKDPAAFAEQNAVMAALRKQNKAAKASAAAAARAPLRVDHRFDPDAAVVVDAGLVVVDCAALDGLPSAFGTGAVAGEIEAQGSGGHLPRSIARVPRGMERYYCGGGGGGGPASLNTKRFRKVRRSQVSSDALPTILPPPYPLRPGRPNRVRGHQAPYRDRGR